MGISALLLTIPCSYFELGKPIECYGHVTRGALGCWGQQGAALQKLRPLLIDNWVPQPGEQPLSVAKAGQAVTGNEEKQEGQSTKQHANKWKELRVRKFHASQLLYKILRSVKNIIVPRKRLVFVGKVCRENKTSAFYLESGSQELQGSFRRDFQSSCRILDQKMEGWTLLCLSAKLLLSSQPHIACRLLLQNSKREAAENKKKKYFDTENKLKQVETMKRERSKRRSCV